jgi:hypothetical protein
VLAFYYHIQKVITPPQNWLSESKDSAKDCRFCSGVTTLLPIIENVKVCNDSKLARYQILCSKSLFVSEQSAVDIDSQVRQEQAGYLKTYGWA